MSDLIRREDAIDKIREVYKYEFPTASGAFDEFVTVIIPNLLRNLPSAETERKKGEWVYDGIRGRFPACKCSICGHYENADWALLQGANYCPHCGADLRGV